MISSKDKRRLKKIKCQSSLIAVLGKLRWLGKHCKGKLQRYLGRFKESRNG
jgi:hypothetical protein